MKKIHAAGWVLLGLILTAMPARSQDEALTHYLLGLQLASEGQLDEAIGEMRSAWSINPEGAEIATELARFLLEARAPAEAIPPAQAAIRLAPENADSHWLLGQAYVQQSKEGEAIPHLKKAWELEPDRSNYQVTYLLALESEKRFEEALALLTPEEGGAEPNNPYLYMRRGALHQRLGQPHEALIDFLAVLERAPGFPGAADHLLAICWRLGPSRVTADACQRALEYVPNRSDLRRELTRILILLNRQEDAIPSLERLLIDQPADPGIPMQLGVIRYGQERLREAVRLFRRAQKLNPDLPDLDTWLWRALNRADSVDAALSLSAEMASKKPEDPTAAWFHANSLARLGRATEALAALERVESLQPENRDARLLSSILLQEEGDTTASLLKLESVLTTHPQDHQTLFRLAVLEERRGELGKSLAWFRRLLELYPDDALALNYAGYMCADAGTELESALEWTSRAVSLDATNGSYIDSYGWVLYRLGRHEEAVEQLEEAARILPEEEEVLLHLAHAYRAADQKGRGIKVLQRLLRENPQHRVARELLQIWGGDSLETGNPR